MTGQEHMLNCDSDKLISLIKECSDIVVLTGAGISTLSGIPDFRGNGGVYTKSFRGLRVEEILSIDFFKSKPEIFYAWCKDVWYNLDKYEPNIVHKVLATLEKRGKIRGIYTQNIDMLHQKAGNKKVYELHGSPYYNTCIKCGKKFSYDEISKIVNSDKVPYCDKCKGLIKPDIILYNEALNQNVLRNAFDDFASSTLCLVLGTSLTVAPSSHLPSISLQNGITIAIINKSETYIDEYANFRFDNLERFFEELNREL